MKTFWLNSLLWVVTRMTSDELIRQLKWAVNYAAATTKTGPEKREMVLRSLDELATPFATHLINLALEAVVTWTRHQLATRG